MNDCERGETSSKGTYVITEAYTVSSVNAAIKVNDEISGVVGENAVRDIIGAEKMI